MEMLLQIGGDPAPFSVKTGGRGITPFYGFSSPKNLKP